MRIARHDAREIHHLRESDHAPPPQQPFEVADSERAPRRLERRRGHARRRHEVHVERDLGGGVEQPVHAVRAQHVRDLVRVGDHGGRSEREHEAGELVREQLRRLEVHVRVDEPGDDVLAGRVDRLASFVVAEPGDPAVCDRNVRLEPLAREHRQHAAAVHDDVGRLVAAGDCETSGEIGHAPFDPLTRAEYASRRGRAQAPHARRGASDEG